MSDFDTLFFAYCVPTIKPIKSPDTIEKLTLFTLCVQIKLSQKFPVPSAPKQKMSIAKNPGIIQFILSI